MQQIAEELRISGLMESAVKAKRRLSSLPAVIRFLSDRRKRAFYVGFVGHGNLGDEALYEAIQDIFVEEYVFYSSQKAERFIRSAARYRKINAVFLGGGTLIGRGDHYLSRLRTSLETMPTLKAVTFGTGVVDVDMWNTFGVPTDTIAWCSVLEKCDFLSVRGPLSKAHLQSWGLKKEIQVIGDPAMWYAKPRMSPKPMEKRIGVNLGPSNGNILGRDERSVLEFGARLLRLLDQEGWTITLFPMTAADATYLEEAVRFAGITVREHRPFLDIKMTLNAMEQQDIFIGEKLHSVILANCAYTPAIMLEYRTKCRDYMSLTEQENLTFRTDHLRLDEIYLTLVDLYDSISYHQQHIYDRMQNAKLKLCEAAKQICTMCVL